MAPRRTSAAGTSPSPILCPIPDAFARLAPLIVDDLARLGSAHDGGYVVPRSAVMQADMLISLGIGDDWSFDAACVALRPGLKIHAYDNSISDKGFRRRTIAAAALLLTGQGPLAELTDAYRTWRDYRRFFDRKRGSARHFSKQIADREDRPWHAGLDTVFGRAPGRDIICKIDIEGAEYRIVEALAAQAARIPLLIVEFHDTLPCREMFARALVLLGEHYEIVHVHGNNFATVAPDGLPEVLEITFLRRDRCPANAGRRTRLPLAGLDAPNSTERADLALVFPEVATRP